MELSARLRAVTAFVSHGQAVADIGCDHGYSSIFLAEHGIASRVIAMDVNEGPLQQARENISRYGMEERIETRLSDGMEALQAGEVTAAVLAGMGGRLMIRILQQGMERAIYLKELVLQPQSEIHLVRKFLRDRNYEIVQEDMILEDGKYYPIIRALQKPGENDLLKQGENALAEQRKMEEDTWNGCTLKDYYGPCLLAEKNPVLFDFLQSDIEKIKKIEQDNLLRDPDWKNQEMTDRMERTERALTYFA